MEVNERIEIEKKVLHKLLKVMREKGWIPLAVHDGEEFQKVITDEDVEGHVFAVDEATIGFLRADGAAHTVLFIMGNDGWDVIADYSFNDEDDFKTIMEEHIDPFCLELEEASFDGS